MRRALPILGCLLPVTAASAQVDEAAGLYTCIVRHKFDGELFLSQTLSAQGRPLRTYASWVQPGGLYNRKRPEDRDVSDPSYMTISVESEKSPAANDPAWFDMAGAKVQITVVTRKRLKGATAITFHRPAHSFDRYEPAIWITASNSRNVPWSVASLPYRVFAAFADGESKLDWMLLRYVGGDSGWDTVEQGRFDLAKVDAFARAAQEARPALAAMTADFRRQCEFEPVTDEPNPTDSI